MNEPDDRNVATEANGKASIEGAEQENTAAEAAATPEAPPEDPVVVARAETARMRDQLLRTAADFDNFRKRSRRELDDAYTRGRESILKDLLPVFDNLERATAHAGEAADVKAFTEGLRIVLKQFSDTLERTGVSRVPTLGLPFDPAVHEAIQHLPSAEHPAGVIMAEVQPGYRIGNHLVRAAMVVVSKGPPSES